jgi:hypothetical protein
MANPWELFSSLHLKVKYNLLFEILHIFIISAMYAGISLLLQAQSFFLHRCSLDMSKCGEVRDSTAARSRRVPQVRHLYHKRVTYAPEPSLRTSHTPSWNLSVSQEAGKS